MPRQRRALGRIALPPLAAALLVLCALSFLPAGRAEVGPTGPLAVGGRIAFMSDNNSLFVINPDGTGRAPLTTFVRSENSPSWSPDGTKIVFARRAQSNQNDDLWVVNSDGSGLTLLVPNGGQPAWSPNGQKIAFTRFINGSSDILTANASDGGGVVNLTNSASNDMEPAWSPDGSKIAFSSNRDMATPSDPSIIQKVFVMNADGSGAHRLTDIPVGTATEVTPAWSPDGSRIAYSRREAHAANNFEVYAANADGSNQVNLSNHVSSDYDPSWSPDGSRIVFVSFRDAGQGNNTELYMMDADGQFPTRVTNNTVPDYWPSWGVASSATPTPTPTPTPTVTPTPFPPFNITGRVATQGGAPVAGVHVIITTQNNGSRSTLTGADGRYALKYTADSRVTISPAKNGYSFDPSAVSYVSSGSVTGDKTQDFTAIPFAIPSTFELSAAAYTVSEGSTTLTATVTRAGTGTFASGALVSYRTTDDHSPVRCDAASSVAYPRCDYQTAVDTLHFAATETQKTFTVSVVNDAHQEGPETFGLQLFDPVGATLGPQSAATVTITDNDTGTAPNPIFDPRFFVRQHYLDFLSREPESGGFATWVGLLENCPAGDTQCDRVAVSAGFFGSPEFGLKGYYVFRFYKVALGRLPTYAEITVDMRRVTGQFDDEVEPKRVEYADGWVGRAAFQDRYPSNMTPEAYVDKLIQTAGVTLTGAVTRDTLVADLKSGAKTRAQVLRAITEHPEVQTKELNSAFVAMQYYGYLRRDPEEPGYTNWLNTLNARPNDFRTMVSGFINSEEYKLRFGQQ